MKLHTAKHQALGDSYHHTSMLESLWYLNPQETKKLEDSRLKKPPRLYRAVCLMNFLIHTYSFLMYLKTKAKKWDTQYPQNQPPFLSEN